MGEFLGSDTEQVCYEAGLSLDIVLGYPPHSSLPDHVHVLDSFQCSPHALKRILALSTKYVVSPPVVLLDDCAPFRAQMCGIGRQ